MKAKIFGLLTLFLFTATVTFGASKTEKFEVKGNCDMCKQSIEQAAKSVESVTQATWDQETQKVEVVFDDTKTDLDQIEKAVAKAGHDTPNYKATDEDYNKLPDCCKFREKEE